VTTDVAEAEVVEVQQDDDDVVKDSTIEFHGRTLAVTMVDAEQVAIMEMIAQRYQRLNPETTDAKKIVRGYKRMIGAVLACVRDDDDREWVEDLILSKEVSIVDAAEIISAAVQAINAENGAVPNRQDKRRAARRTKTTKPALVPAST
jgi:hypothetical protein